MPRRKSSAISDATELATPRRSTRTRAPVAAAPEKDAKVTSKAASKGSADKDESKALPKPAKGRSTKRKVEDGETQDAASPAKKAAKPSKETKPAKEVKPAKQDNKPKPKPAANGSAADSGGSSDGKQYWLMKAEPETRFENGVDVKFSIDDLAAKTKPEPWDGIRAYPARNNLRAMKKGELAFFYHSNCKEPAIVGTMEIVEEHSPDLSAHDPKAPYYDASSKPSDPKWSVVHVKFRSKFAVPIGLKELRTYTGAGQPLEHMQMLRMGRLSVSRVSAAEWDYLTDLAEQKAKEAE